MIIKLSLTGETSFQTEIKKACSGLIIKKVGGDFITDERIGVTLNSKTAGSITTIPTAKIRTCAVMSQFGSGYQLEQVIAGGQKESVHYIKLGPTGNAIALNDENYLELNLTGLDENAEYKIIGYEYGFKDKFVFKQWSKSIPLGDPAQTAYGIEPNTAMVYLSNNEGLESVKVKYVGGDESTFTPEEFAVAARNKNNTSFSADKIVEGDALNQTISGAGTELFFLDVRKVDGITVNSLGTAVINVIFQSVETF